jgi:glycine/sarcosine N-methyltransferase
MFKPRAGYANNPKNSQNRADLWGDYVGWGQRLEGEGTFLTKQLGGHGVRSVLDAALGDGIDTIYLTKAGFDVKCNEADPAFRERAKANAAAHGIAIEPTSEMWPDLAKSYSPASFDAVICLGHSIGCVLDADSRQQSLTAFRDMLKPGGILVVDERNFRKVEDSIELNRPFTPSGKHVYTGSAGKIALTFVEHDVDERIVGIEYRHTETSKRAYYRVYSFKEGELPDTLHEAGFVLGAIETYSDYRHVNPPDPTADYYQHVAVNQA